jgi:hypothetical protein
MSVTGCTISHVFARCDIGYLNTLRKRVDMWGQRQLDSRALEMASAVAARQDHHEDECTRRYGALDGTLRSLHEKMDESRLEREAAQRRVYGLLWKFAMATIGMLIVIVGYLLAHGVPWQLAK